MDEKDFKMRQKSFQLDHEIKEASARHLVHRLRTILRLVPFKFRLSFDDFQALFDDDLKKNDSLYKALFKTYF